MEEDQLYTPPAKKKRGWMRFVWALLVLIVIGAAGAGGYVYWSGQKTEIGPAAMGAFQSVELDEARVGMVNRQVSAVGTLVANQSVDMMFQVPGRIEKLHVESGAPVQKGDPLISLEDTEYKARLKEAEAKLTFARLSYERAVQLAERKAGPEKEKEKASAEMISAEASVEKAKYELDNTLIRAPFEGVVGLINMSVGAYVKQNDKVLSLIDLDPIKVDFNVPGTFVRFITPGQQVKVIIDGFESRDFIAEVEAVDPRVDPQTHSLPVRAVMDNKRGFLKAGLFGKVDLVAGTKSQVTLISDKAILTDDDRLFVYVVQKMPEDVARKYGRKNFYLAVQRYVKTGINEGGSLEITEGLQPGDKVVVIGQHKLSGPQLPVTFPEADDAPIDLTMASSDGASAVEEGMAEKERESPKAPPAGEDAKTTSDDVTTAAETGKTSDEAGVTAPKEANDNVPSRLNADTETAVSEKDMSINTAHDRIDADAATGLAEAKVKLPVSDEGTQDAVKDTTQDALSPVREKTPETQKEK